MPEMHIMWEKPKTKSNSKGWPRTPAHTASSTKNNNL